MWYRTFIVAGGLLVLSCTPGRGTTYAPHVWLREDLSRQLTPERCADGAGFRDGGTQTPGFGLTDAAWWLRFEIPPHGSELLTIFINWPHLDQVDVFFFRERRLLTRHATGRLVALDARPVRHHTLLVPVPPAGRAPTVVCMRVATVSTLQVPVRVLGAYPLLRLQSGYTLFFGLYYGTLLAVLVYNAFLFVSFREASFGVYCLYVVSMCAFQLNYNGLSYYFWPDSPEWNRRFTLFAITAISLSGAFFVRSFLETARLFPRLDLAIRGAIALVLIEGLAVVAGLPYGAVATVQVLTACALVSLGLVCGFISLAAGHRPARWFLLAWSMPLVAIFLHALRALGLVPVFWFTEHVLQISTGAEMLLLSIALSDRVHLLRQDLRQANERLDRTVSERTAQLSEALAHLSQRTAALDNELALARSIQDWILAPPHYIGDRAEIYVHCEFLHAVGGDFYEYLEFPDGELGLVVADAAGHGIPAGFLTALAKISFAEAARRAGPVPRSILLDVNAEMNRLIKTHEYLTAALMVFGPRRQVRYSAAGHRPSYLLQRATRKLTRLHTPGTLIGVFPSDDELVQCLEEVSVDVAPGDRVLLLTDGATDVMDGDGQMLGNRALAEFFRDTAHLSAADAFEAILRAWRAYFQNGSREDDATIVLVEIR